jgi:TrmH family RNA methyltransferase
MLSNSERARFTVVLVGARNPQNIGAAARAMQDFGFSDLRVVNEFAAPFEAAQLDAGVLDLAEPAPKSAVGAANVMQSARRFNDLAEAIADCHLVAGTTAIGGREMEREILALAEGVPLLLAGLKAPVHESAEAPRVALLFGSEKTGLTNEQLSHCSLLLTIPMYAPENARHLSMNLGQSVAVCLYELVRGGFEGSRELPVLHEATATADDRERITQLLLRAMLATDYARRFPANSREHVVRQLAQQLGKSRDEASTWMGFLKHVGRMKLPDQE